MAKIKFTLDRAGLGAVATSSEMADVIRGLADAIAEHVQGEFPDADQGVVVDEYEFKATTRAGPRAAFSVTVRDPLARKLEAKDGLLTRAAAAEGLEVKSRVSD